MQHDVSLRKPSVRSTALRVSPRAAALLVLVLRRRGLAAGGRVRVVWSHQPPAVGAERLAGFADRHVQQDRGRLFLRLSVLRPDRKSTRLNSSHLVISYAV